MRILVLLAPQKNERPVRGPLCRTLLFWARRLLRQAEEDVWRGRGVASGRVSMSHPADGYQGLHSFP